MVEAFLALLGCQLIGEFLVRLFKLALPGPVVGMVLLFLLLVLRGKTRTRTPLPGRLETVADGLLGNLSLLFVPAAVGIVQNGAVMATSAWPIALAILVSTVGALAVSGIVFAAFDRPSKLEDATSVSQQSQEVSNL